MRLASFTTEELRSRDSNTEPTLQSFPAAGSARAWTPRPSGSVSRAVFAFRSGRDRTEERLLLFRETNHTQDSVDSSQ